MYGGAVSLDDEVAKRVVTSRIDDRREQKAAIARKAYEIVEDGQVVFLDISSTNLYLADLFAEGPKSAVVVSNMLDVVKRVAAGKNVVAECPAGRMNLELFGLVGSKTVRDIARIRFDLAFLGTLEINVDDDSVSTFDMEDGAVKQTALEGSARSYLVADSHKFRARGSYRYARISDFTGIITDSGAGAQAQALGELGVDLL